MAFNVFEHSWGNKWVIAAQNVAWVIGAVVFVGVVLRKLK